MLTEQNIFQLNCKPHSSLPHSLFSWQVMFVQGDWLVGLCSVCTDKEDQLSTDWIRYSLSINNSLSMMASHSCVVVAVVEVVELRLGVRVPWQAHYPNFFFAPLWSFQICAQANTNCLRDLILLTLAQCCHDVKLNKEHCKPLNVCVVRDALQRHISWGKWNSLLSSDAVLLESPFWSTAAQQIIAILDLKHCKLNQWIW